MRWLVQPNPNQETVQSLAKALSVPSVVAQLLVQRGVTTFDAAKQFFRPDWSDLHDPFLMKDMKKAVDRLQDAINNNETIMVFGDYDVDGTSAVAFLVHYLRSQKCNVISYIPDRYAEGYGLSQQGIDKAVEEGVGLLFTLDCGIKAVDLIADANQKGLDVIICDHHTPGEQLPAAHAVLDPKRPDCSYPFDGLCGCGVVFKFIQAHASTLGVEVQKLQHYLDLVATASAADIVPILDENRVLTYFGMQVYQQSPRPGLMALLGERKQRAITVTDLVFRVAPRINAAGRMKHGTYAVELLLSETTEEASKRAEAIEAFNEDRKALDRDITEQALAQIEEGGQTNKASTVVYDPNWHKGVIGIVASRLIETHYKPTVVFTRSGDVLTASARSVRGFDLYAALSESQEYMIQFGGHKYAAGLTIRPEHYDGFCECFEQVVSRQIQPDQQERTLRIDMEISIEEITPKLYRIINQMAPFGPGNMRPVLLSKGVTDRGYAKRVGSDETHLKCSFVAGAQSIDAIGFGLGDVLEIVQSSTCDIAYVVDENEWNGKTSLQLNLKGVK
jgi:single-stranded-DNA-specific exonuclease